MLTYCLQQIRALSTQEDSSQQLETGNIQSNKLEIDIVFSCCYYLNVEEEQSGKVVHENKCMQLLHVGNNLFSNWGSQLIT